MAYQSMDFPQLFLAAQQLREGRQRSELGNLQLEQGRAELDARRTAIARDARLRQALAAWHQGNKGPLQAEFPAEAQKLVESEVDLEAKRASLGKTTAEAEGLRRKSQIEKMSTTARALRSAADMARANPQAAPLIGRRLSAMAQDGTIMLPGGKPLTEIVSPDELDAMATEAESGAAGFERPELTGRMRDVAASIGMGKAPERALDKPEFSRAMAKQLAKEGGVKVSVGMPGVAEEATAGVKGQLQTKVIENTNLLRQIGEISSIDPRSYLGLTGKLKETGAKIVDWLGASKALGTEEYLKRKVKIAQTVESIFNAYRKEITGAGANVNELEQLKNSIVNMELGPTEFGFALERFRDELLAQTRLYRRALRVGVEIGRKPTGQELTRQIDEWRLDGDSGITSEDIDARFEELTGQGKSEVAASRILYQEGYINAAQLNAVLGASKGKS